MAAARKKNLTCAIADRADSSREPALFAFAAAAWYTHFVRLSGTATTAVFVDPFRGAYAPLPNRLSRYATPNDTMSRASKRWQNASPTGPLRCRLVAT